VIEPPPRLRRLRLRRLDANQSLSLWLFVGGLAALSLLYFAVKANVERAFPKVEGAQAEQQEKADQLRAALAEDSTNVDARIALADLLFDTANWPEAIEEYSAALRRDSSRVEALVDLGVCYYNLGDGDRAGDCFERALQRNPHHTIALFNLGILNERREQHDAALRYYHLALQTDPVEEIRGTIIAAITRVQEASGKTAPRLR
jgi:tetratricopeptide (TPR) repeat protein